MAVRKTGVKRTRNSEKKTSDNDNRVPFSMIFWLLFFIVLITAFFMLLPRVTKGVNIPQKHIATEQPAPEKSPVPEQSAQPEKPPAAKPSKKPSVEKPPAAPAKETVKETPKETAKNTPKEKPPSKKPAEQTPSQPKTQQPASKPPPVSQPAEKPAETRDRTIYFMRDGGAELQLTKVNRKLKVSDSPLFDCVNALIAGPTAEEKNRGFISFVPPGTRLISAQVRQNTVFLNFNEEFRYNTLGREGCAAQLKQIVWTATEFPNVQDVQIQIEGKTVDFLMEGITIRNPIGRN